MAAVAVGGQLQEFVGVLRALDLGGDWLKVDVENGPQVLVRELSQAVDDVIGPMVNKSVLVRAVKTAPGDLMLLDIVLAP